MTERSSDTENVIRFGAQEDLLGRDTIEIELPRFLVRAFEEQVAKANAGASEEDQVSLNDYLELHLAEHLSIADVAGLEPRERVARRANTNVCPEAPAGRIRRERDDLPGVTLHKVRQRSTIRTG